MTSARNLDQSLAHMDAVAHEDCVFVHVREVPKGLNPFAIINEAEGPTLILPLEEAKRVGLDLSEIYTRITLQLHTALDGVGLTATITQILSSRSIPCNVVAGYYHDHLFVPPSQAPEALDILADISRQANGWLAE